jgi:phage-related protein
MAQFDPSFTQDFTYEGITYTVRYHQMMEIRDHAHYLQAIVPLKVADPFGYSEENSLTGSGTATNAGNYETFPTLTIPPSTDPTVQVGTDVLTYTGTIGAGDTLIIDCEARTAVIGSTNVLKNLSGDWPVLAVGDNTVTVSEATTIMTWRDKSV